MDIHADVLAAAHTAVLGEIDAEGATAALKIRNSADALLATLVLDFPAGTVSAVTGQLTIGFGATPNGVASGTADYAELCDALGKVLIGAIPCAEGTTPVANTCVLSSLAIVSGAPVAGVTFTIG